MRKLIAKILTCWIPFKTKRKMVRKAILFKIAKKVHIDNDAIIHQIPCYDGAKKTLLFVFPDVFYHTGGKETRMLAMFEALEQKGYRIVIIANHQSVHQELITKHQTYLLDFGNIHSFSSHYKINENIASEIIQIAIKQQAKLIEFNLCGNQHDNIDYQKIANVFPIGFHYHEKPKEPNNIAKYNIVNSPKNMMDKPSFHVIFNPIKDHVIQQKYQYNHQSKALLISRISDDKMDVLLPALQFFKQHHMEFDIAAPLDKNHKLVHKICKQFDLKEQQFIGKINTINFLAQNIHQYLFVAGVGQVVLEAGAQGYPVLLSTKNGNAHFIEQQYFDHYGFYNLTKPDTDLTIDAERQLQDILSGNNYQPYNLIDPIKKNYSMSVIIDKYIDILEEAYKS